MPLTRLFTALLLGWISLGAGSYSYASDEDLFRQRIVKHLNEANSNYWDPVPQSVTEAPGGPEVYQSLVAKDLYPRLKDAVVYVVSSDGVMGSGTIISSSFGLVITNWHVVGNEPTVGLVFKPATTQGRVTFSKEDVFFARVLKTDSMHDLALLEIVAPPNKITAVPMGSAERVEAGQDVFSISHPQGSLWSYHETTVSQKEPDHEWISEIGTNHRAVTIHTQAIETIGNSGDPLFDRTGRFVGLLAGNSEMGNNFAISVDEIRKFVFSSLRKSSQFTSPIGE